MKRATLLLPFLLLLCLSACREPKDPEFKEFRNLKIKDVGFSSANLTVDLIFFNPNNFGLELNKTDLNVFIDNTFLGKSRQDVQIRIPRKDMFTIPMKIDLDMKNLIKGGLTALLKKEVTIRFTGKVKVGKAGVMKNFNIDYSTNQQLSLF